MGKDSHMTRVIGPGHDRHKFVGVTGRPTLACNLEGNEMLCERFRRERGEANTSQVCALRLFGGLFGRWTKLRGATVAVGGS